MRSTGDVKIGVSLVITLTRIISFCIVKAPQLHNLSIIPTCIQHSHTIPKSLISINIFHPLNTHTMNSHASLPTHNLTHTHMVVCTLTYPLPPLHTDQTLSQFIRLSIYGQSMLRGGIPSLRVFYEL